MPTSKAFSEHLAAFDAAAIKDHLTIIHNQAAGHNGKLVVAVFNQDMPGTVTHHRIGDIEGMCTSVMAHANTPGANVYPGLQSMRLALPRHQRGSESDIVAVHGFVADVDNDKGMAGKMPVEPSYVIETSPGNYQTAILFDKPMNPASA